MRHPHRLSLASLFATLCLAVVGLRGGATAAPGTEPARANGTLTIFAAASLTQAFTAIGASFGKANGVTVRFNFAGSDALVTQLDQGAPADVFASANQTQMTSAAAKGLIAGTPVVFARNLLTVIVPRSNPAHLYSLPDLGRPGINLVLAAPAVPVGKYARAALAIMANDTAFGANFLARITANTKSLETDVKAVAAKVSLGEADAGIVYVTDVTPSVASKVLTIPIPAPFNQRAVYPIAVTKTSANAALAQKFVDYVRGPAGQAALRASGFITSLPVAIPSSSFTISGLVTTPATLTVADLQKLPATTVKVTLRTDKGTQGVYSYTGVLLNTVLQRALPLTNTSFKNDAVRQFVTVGAADGYQVTIGMAEILTQFGHQQIILAYKRDGKLLGADEGAVRLIVPDDTVAGRWVSNVNSVVVGTPVGTPS